MARRTGLREYQQSLIERLQRVETEPTTVSKLGFLVGSERWLVDIAATREVVPVPAITPFALSQPWFLGIVNVRGRLMGLVDFLHFLSASDLPRAPHNRILVFEGELGAHFGLLVSRMLGLKRSDELRARPDAVPPSSLVGALYEDSDGSVWNELDIRALLSDRRFLEAGAG